MQIDKIGIIHEAKHLSLHLTANYRRREAVKRRQFFNSFQRRSRGLEKTRAHKLDNWLLDLSFSGRDNRRKKNI